MIQQWNLSQQRKCRKTTADLHTEDLLSTAEAQHEDENTNIIEYRLKLDSNPEFTGSVLTAVARAVYRMSQEGQTGCRTMLDIPPAYLSTKTTEEFLKNML